MRSLLCLLKVLASLLGSMKIQKHC
jgi:hypothetical protein